MTRTVYQRELLIKNIESTSKLLALNFHWFFCVSVMQLCKIFVFFSFISYLKIETVLVLVNFDVFFKPYITYVVNVQRKRESLFAQHWIKIKLVRF